ncbi:MAG: hypothetical protein HRU36_02880 [Rickettsiales bacterium]|nr:hypothetical protein [Rickettsiales bacterium]
MIRIKHLHPNQIKTIKSNSRIFEAYLRQILHLKDYENLRELMAIKQDYIGYFDEDIIENILIKQDYIGYFDEDIIENILHDNDYKALKIIANGLASQNSATQALNNLMRVIIENLDVKAANITLEEALNSNADISSLDVYKFLKEDSDPFELYNNLIGKKLKSNSPRTAKKEIAKNFFLATYKQSSQKQKECPQDPIDPQSMANKKNCQKTPTTENFKQLSYYLTKEEADSFIREHNIDFTALGINLKDHYPHDDDPLLNQDQPISSISDILLQKTYSDNLSSEEVQDVYKPLFSSNDHFVRETMAIVTLSIIGGDNLKIIFSNKTTTASFYDEDYNLYTNVVEVGSNYKKSECFSLASVTMHEMGHYGFNKLYNSQSMPFNFTLLNGIYNDSSESLHRFQEGFDGDNIYVGVREVLNLKPEEKVTLRKIFKNFDTSKLDLFLDMLQDYEMGVRNFLSYIFNLIQIEDASIKLDKHLSSSDFLEYTKQEVPIIDLFHASSLTYFNEHHNSSHNYSYSVTNNVYEVYSQGIGSNICPNDISHFHFMSLQDSLKEMIKYSLNLVVEGYHLTQPQIFLLERAADFVNRHDSKMDHSIYESYHHSNDNIVYAELIVRYAELHILDNNQELGVAFADILNFWQKYISPDIQNQINQYKTECDHLMSMDSDTQRKEVDIVAGLQKCEAFFDWWEGQ